VWLGGTYRYESDLVKTQFRSGRAGDCHGKVLKNLSAQDYHAYKEIAMTAVLESYQRLGQQYETIVVEGAGSPAEINLRANDIANMGFAEVVDCPVILIADIDRAGYSRILWAHWNYCRRANKRG